MGESGSVAWMFDRVSIIEGKPSAAIEDPETEAIEVGANEVTEGRDPGTFEFFANPEDLDSVRNGLTQRKWTVTAAKLGYKSKNTTKLNPDQEKEVNEFLVDLDENDDSQSIFSTSV